MYIQLCNPFKLSIQFFLKTCELKKLSNVDYENGINSTGKYNSNSFCIKLSFRQKNLLNSSFFTVLEECRMNEILTESEQCNIVNDGTRCNIEMIVIQIWNFTLYNRLQYILPRKSYGKAVI